MKIILLEEVAKLGKAGDLVNVSAGYGRNYLLPKKYAVLATAKSIKNLEGIKRNALEKITKAQNVLKATALELTGTELFFRRKADENGHLFGSVSDADIVADLAGRGFEITKSMITGNTHIKQTGIYDFAINFAPEIKAQIKVDVQSEE